MAGVGGWAVIVPFIFIDPTTSKNEAHNSYEFREEELRRIAKEKSCSSLPEQFGPDMSVKQMEEVLNKKVAKAGGTRYTVVGKGYCDNCNIDNRPIIGKDVFNGDRVIYTGEEFQLKSPSGEWYIRREKFTWNVKELKELNNGKYLGVRAPEGTTITIDVIRDVDTPIKWGDQKSGGNVVSTQPVNKPNKQPSLF
jgi:hypothetical protein